MDTLRHSINFALVFLAIQLMLPIPSGAMDKLELAAPTGVTVGEDETAPDGTQDRPDDSVGIGLGWAVLVGMSAALAYAVWRLMEPETWHRIATLKPAVRPRSWAIPLLCLVGLGIASYLTYVEVNQVEALCGPIGECNRVQSSRYAQLLGVPIAVWGVLNYLAVMALWMVQKFLDGRSADLAQVGLLGLLLFGTLFSVYLTCLELFAIHAVCAWCLGSAVVTTTLMILVLIPTTDLAGPALGDA